MIKHEATYLNDGGLPVVWQPVEGSDAPVEDVAAWLAEMQPEVEQVLLREGALLLRGFQSLGSAADFERLLGVVAPQLMDYVGGTSPRRAVRGRIMTATEIASTYSIPLHQEMSYTDGYPDRIAFFCERPADHGGATLVGDMREALRRIDVAVVERWRERGVQLRRTLPAPEVLHKKPGVPKPWTEVFSTTDRGKVDEIAATSGWRTSWLDDRSVQLWQEVRPATLQHPITGEEVWFNQAHAFAPATTLKWAWEDGRLRQWARLKWATWRHPEMLDRVFHVDGEPIPDEDVLHVYEVLGQSSSPLYWQRGDLLLLDNILGGHGRTAFTGERRVLTALIRQPAVETTAAEPRRVAGG